MKNLVPTRKGSEKFYTPSLLTQKVFLPPPLSLPGPPRQLFMTAPLQSRELNLALRKTTVRISKFLGQILKGMSNIILQLMFSIVGDFNNLRNSKNALL